MAAMGLGWSGQGMRPVSISTTAQVELGCTQRKGNEEFV
jgi:hypothetical protein